MGVVSERGAVLPALATSMDACLRSNLGNVSCVPFLCNPNSVGTIGAGTLAFRYQLALLAQPRISEEIWAGKK